MDTSPRYDGIADFYADAVGDDVDDPVTRSLLELAGDVGGQRVLDLACGQGRVTRELARRGAAVVGVDVSEELLSRASGGLDYRLVDATAPDALMGERFDLVVCHFGLSDVDDLNGALATVARVLEPGGRFVFSILHPCFPGWGDDAPSSWRPGNGYYSEGWWLASNTGFRGRVGSNHRMLSTYLGALFAHELPLDGVAEPEPTGAWAASKPDHDPGPVYLVARCRRA